MSDEQILVVRRDSLGDLVENQGFQDRTNTTPESLWSIANFKSRELMESDPSFKQLIPYIMLRYQDQVYRYWRTKKAGESRLHHLYSIGVGGHINPQDENLLTADDEIMIEAAMRELREEIAIEDDVDLKWVGWINDDSTDVGQVHLGIVYEAWLKHPEIKTNEAALGRGEWKRISKLNDFEYETWSQFLIDGYLLK